MASEQRMLNRSLALVACAWCACDGAATPDPAAAAKVAMAPVVPSDAPPASVVAKTIAVQVRPPRPWEVDLTGVVYDTALDCVANRIHDLSDPDRYAAVAACGEPFIVNDAKRVMKDAAAKAISELREGTDEQTSLHIGTAVDGEFVSIVSAPSQLELEPYHAGDLEIRGRLVAGRTLSANVSTGAGVTGEKLAMVDGKFAFDISQRVDADVELIGVDPTDKTNLVLARFRIGEGSPLFAVRGTLLERANAARAHVGLAPLLSSSTLGSCDSIAPRVSGVDVTDIATCQQIQSTWSEVLSRQIAYSPSFQSALLVRRAAVLEYGARDATTVSYRLLNRFEQLSPTALHSHVMMKLHDRWPSLVERPVPHDALDIAALAAGKPPVELSPTLQAKLHKVGNTWSWTHHSYVTVVSARDLQQTVNLIDPDDTPDEVAFSARQVRGSDGAMYQVIAIALSQP